MFEEAAYQQALALKAAGDTQGAAEVLAELPDSDRAKAELISIQLDHGAELEAAGDYAAAAEVYAARRHRSVTTPACTPRPSSCATRAT